MHRFNRETLRDLVRRLERTNVLRSDDEAAADRRRAREARVLLLHDATDDAVEQWLDREFPATDTKESV